MEIEGVEYDLDCHCTLHLCALHPVRERVNNNYNDHPLSFTGEEVLYNYQKLTKVTICVITKGLKGSK